METVDVCFLHELFAFREQVYSLQSRVADQGKLRQRERSGKETLRDLPKQSYSCADCSSALWKVKVPRLEGVSLRRGDVIP